MIDVKHILKSIKEDSQDEKKQRITELNGFLDIEIRHLEESITYLDSCQSIELKEKVNSTKKQLFFIKSLRQLGDLF